MMSIVTTVDNEFLENFHLLYNEKHDNNTLKFYCPYIDANSMSFDSLINSLYKRQLFVVYDLGVVRDEVEFKRDIENAKDDIKVIIVKH